MLRRFRGNSSSCLEPGRRFFSQTGPTIFFLLLLIQVTGCGGGGSKSPTPATPSLSAIAITPASPAISIGQTQQFAATGTYSDGSTKDVSSSTTWVSSSTSVASISAAGLATGLAAGQTTISASISGVSGTAILTVSPSLSSIAVTPSSPSISGGAMQQFAATGTYSDGSTKDLSNAATWASSNTTVATISATGLATGVTVGQTTISATFSGISGSVILAVTASTVGVLVQETVDGQITTRSGATVLVDDLPVGHIGTTGSLAVQVLPGSHSFTVLDSGAQGSSSQIVAVGPSIAIAIDVQDSELSVAPSTSTVSQVLSGVLDLNDGTSNSVTFQITDPANNPVSLVTPSAYLTDAGGNITDVTSYTSVASNNPTVNVTAALAGLGLSSSTFAASEPYDLTVYGNTKDGYPYSADVTFEAGIYSIFAKVTSAPSNPGLLVAGGTVVLAKHSSAVTFTATTLADGSFTLPAVPPGQYSVSGTFIGSNGITYNIFGTTSISANANLALIPLGPSDITAGVVSVITSAATSNAFRTLSHKQRRSSSSRLSVNHLSPATITTMPTSSPFGSLVTVSSDAQNVPVNAAGTFNIPAGTATADLLYQVCSEEYPEYVTEQSQYNDVWTVSAEDTAGTSLVNATASVNEMLFSAPIWQPNSCTTVIDVPVTFSSPVQPNSITIDASSVNIGDDELPTTVQVIIVPSTTFSLSLALNPPPSIVHCPTSPAPHAPGLSADTLNITVCNPSKGDYFSVPITGATETYDGLINTFHRPATAKLIYDPASPVTISNVELDAVDLSGTILQTLYNGPLGTVITQTAPDTLKLDLSFTVPSTIADRASVPDRMQFNLIVTGTQNGASASGQGTSPIFNALVPATSDSAVSSIGRYPSSWFGGSDWAKNQTVDWMDQNATLLTRFNDISGEHGRYIGHSTHNFGTAIDIFHFQPFTTTSGTADAMALQVYAESAAAGNATAVSKVAGWVQANRAGLDALFNAGSVQFVCIGKGEAFSAVLGKNWQYGIMTTGMINLADGTSVDLAIGSWTPAGPTKACPGHDNHHHLQLSF